MKAITMYESEDGVVCRTVREAEERDVIFRKCKKAEDDILGPRPEDPDRSFANGCGYRQHPDGTKKRLFEFMKEMRAHRDSNGPIGSLLYRAYCIDSKDREWGQPYFALNEGKGEMKAI